MYKREWQESVYVFLEKIDTFIIDTLEFVESEPNFSSKNDMDIDTLISEIKERQKEAKPNIHIQEDFFKIVTGTKLKTHICNLKYENLSLINEYYMQSENYYSILSSKDFPQQDYSENIKKAFRYFYEELPSSDKFIKKYGDCDVDFKYKVKQIIGEAQTCPYCDVTELEDPIKSLDHYLPQNKFPLLSLYSKNLIVSCTACNERIKGTNFYLPTLHPAIDNIEEYFYFDVEYAMRDYKINIKYNEHLTALETEKITNFLKLFNIEQRYENRGCDIIRRLIKEIEGNVINQILIVETEAGIKINGLDKVIKLINYQIDYQIGKINEQKLINSYSKLKLDFLKKFKIDQYGIQELAEFVLTS